MLQVPLPHKKTLSHNPLRSQSLHSSSVYIQIIRIKAFYNFVETCQTLPSLNLQVKMKETLIQIKQKIELLLDTYRISLTRINLNLQHIIFDDI